MRRREREGEGRGRGRGEGGGPCSRRPALWLPRLGDSALRLLPAAWAAVLAGAGEPRAPCSAPAVREMASARSPFALLSHPGLPDCELVHAPGRQHRARARPPRPSLARVSPAAGIPVPARCERREQATLNITRGLEPPGSSERAGSAEP